MPRFLREELQPRSPARPTRAGEDVERDLLERVAGGDLVAFEELYHAYRPRLLRFLSLLTSRRTIIEESVNDTMFAVWRRAYTFNGQCKVSTWIFAIAYRTTCKALHSQDEPCEEPVVDDRAAEAPGPDGESAAHEAQAALRRALDALSHEQRDVIVLTYFHQLPYAEIAQIMDCPVDTVKTRMFHGRRRLRALLAGEAGDWL